MYIFGDTYFQGAVLKNVFQIVFLLVITSEFLILIFTSWNSHKNSGKKTKSDRGSMLIIMFGYWLAILMNPICIHSFPLIMPTFVFWIGVILTILGVILRVFSVWTLGKFFTLAVQVGSEQKIVQIGPYRLLRHPAYTGSILSLIGIALSFRSPWGVAVTLLIIAAVYGYRIKTEETTLEKSFGLQYQDYEKHTWRLIPYIW
nr:isoprenylcysteine carboxylmethyltransferase family protein [uncultured Caproiciproducens sp.]